MPFVVFGISFGLSLVLIPLVRRSSRRWGKVARPREDRWHSRPTATLGGIGIYLAFMLSLLAAMLLGGGWEPGHWWLLGGSCAIFLVGLYDDLKRITPPAKLVGQILAASLVIFAGYTTSFFNPRIQDSLIAQIPNILLTFFWLVGITNAINLLDNMDGLAGGIGLITAAILAFFFWRAGNPGLLTIALALAGSLLGFLAFNFPPASIFMGDSGSLFLGFTLAVLAIARQPQASNVFAVLGVPTLLFMLPILDTTLVTFTRLLRGQSPSQGGRDHTSHRLIAFGLSERQAVLALYGVALVSGVMAAALESLNYSYSLVVMPALVVSLALLTAYLGGLKVVTPPAVPAQRQALARIMLELTFKRRLLEVILDFFLIWIAYALAFFSRLGFSLDEAHLEGFLRSLPVAVAGTFLSFFTFGVYRGVWRYVGLDDFVRFLRAALGAVAVTAAAVLLLFPTGAYPPVIFLLYAAFLFLGLAASRSSFRLLEAAYRRQARQAEQRVLICGTGDASEIALRWIAMNPQLRYQPVGILNSDPFLAGRAIHGVDVLGSLDQLEAVLQRTGADGVILTADRLEKGDLYQQALEICRPHGCWVRMLRLEFELVE